MTRAQVLSKMIDKANALKGNYSKAKEMEIWTMCSDWNSDHEGEEIFMCESSDDNNVVNGFYIEDDYWLYENMED
jgi:hypothetical protein